MHMGHNAFQMHLKCIWAMPALSFLERCAAPTPQRVEKVCRGELQGAACAPAHLKCISNASQMHFKCIRDAFEGDRAGGAARPSCPPWGWGVLYAFKMHLKCIMAHMHFAQMHYSHMHCSPYAFEMHFKCIWVRMHLRDPICISPHMHLKCISNA